MGGSVSQVFQSGSALLSNGHGHKVSDSTRQKVQTIFDALRANPKIGVQRLEGLLQQIPKVRYFHYCVIVLHGFIIHFSPQFINLQHNIIY